jgi:hypothetical protein
MQPRLCAVWVHRTVRWCTGLSDGAPDSVRWYRLATVNWLLSGSDQRRTAINHRTVRWCTGLPGEPFTGEVVALGKRLTAYGYKSPDCPVVHRTVRWCTGLSGDPTVSRANGRPRNPRATRGQANGQKGAPDCPVCTGQCPMRQRLWIFNGRLHHRGKKSAPDSVRWCTRLSGAPVGRRQELPSWNALNGS